MSTGFAALGALVALYSCSSKEEQAGVSQQELWATRWENLGGDAKDDPAVASWAPGRLDVFWRGTDNNLKHRWFSGGGWSFLENLGGGDVLGSPSAVSSDVNRIDAFYFNSSGNLVRRYINGNVAWTWQTETISVSGASNKPSTSLDGTAVASWAPQRLDVFWRGSDGHLKHVWKPNDATAWQPAGSVEDLGESLSSEPAAVSWGNLQIDVFWAGSSGELMHKWFDSCPGCNTWSVSKSRTGSSEVAGSPSVASWASNRLDVFWRRPTSGHLGHIWKDGGGSDSNWNGWVQDLGGGLASGPDAVSWDTGRIDIVGRISSGSDIARFTWQTPDQSNPWYNGASPAATVLADDANASWWSNSWEFSMAACPSGAYAVAGKHDGVDMVAYSASPTATATPTAGAISFAANTAPEDDTSMVRGPGGDLWLLRGLLMGTNCGASNPDSCVNDGCGSEYRSATQLFRSSDCGHNWTSVSTIDPASASYSNGAFGGGPCWGGWDREELYYDYWSNRLFATFNGETDSVPETRSMFALRSPAGGTGTFSFNRINDYTAQPYVMTSLPGIANTSLTGMVFMFSCEGRANEGFAVNRPILRWIDPNSTGWTTNNANWHDALINSGALKASFNDVSPLDSQTCVSGFPGLDGSQTVTRVGSYIDDAGVAWWTVRLGFLSSTTNVRVLTVRVNGVGDVEVVGSAQNFAASAGTTVAQLTAIEPDPAQTLSGSSWSGENTSLYYWRELNAGTNTYAIKAAAVRDAAGWQAPFTVASGVGTGKGGDFARGGFYFDSSTPETPLKYIMTWVGGGGQLKREVVALPAGLGNN